MSLTDAKMDAEEGLALLTGGLTLNQMKDVNWDESLDMTMVEVVPMMNEKKGCPKKREPQMKSFCMDMSQNFDIRLSVSIFFTFYKLTFVNPY
jgi:hypothetical protein